MTLYLEDAGYNWILALAWVITCRTDIKKLVGILEFSSKIIYALTKVFKSFFKNYVII